MRTIGFKPVSHIITSGPVIPEGVIAGGTVIAESQIVYNGPIIESAIPGGGDVITALQGLPHRGTVKPQ